MYTDSPLNEKNEDRLGRYFFAEEIANGLVQSFSKNHASLVIGINGAWGSGKSTLVNFIVKEVERLSIERGETVIILPFNPWMFSGQSALQNIFLKELYLKFESQKDKLKRASKKLANFLGHLNWLKYAHSGAGEAIKEAQTLLEGLNKERSLQELKAEVDNILIKSEVKLYITIDDIDRLTPSEITDIFQLVKLNGNFANTVFLLAYDKDVVFEALKQQFGSNGKKYIEKIVQVDYTLPEVSRRDIERIFVDSIESVLVNPELKASFNASFEDIKTASFVRLFNSLRDVYRFINGLRLRLPSIYRELNLRDFFILEALRIFRPDAYNFILSSKDILVQYDKSHFSFLSLTKKSESESKSEAIDKTSHDDLTKDLIRELFHLRDKVFFQVEDQDDLIREKRIANPYYFDRYFNLQLSDSDLPETLFNEFIDGNGIDKKVEILRSLSNTPKLFHFLNWVEIRSKKAPQQKLESIISSALRYSDFVKYQREGSFDNSDFMILQGFASRILEHLRNLDKRRVIIQRHIGNSEREFSFSSCYTLARIIEASKRNSKHELYHYHLWFYLFSDNSEENEKYIEQLWRLYKDAIKYIFKKYIKDTNTLNGNELFWLLDDIKEYHPELYDREFKKLLSNDNTLLLLLGLCITSKFRSTGTSVAYQLTEDQLFPGMDTEKIKNRLEKIDLGKLSKDEVATVKFYKKAYSEGFLEERYYDFYTQVEFKLWD